MLGSSGVAAQVLVPGPIPLPCTISCDVAFLDIQTNHPYAGLFLAYQTTGQEADKATLLQFVQQVHVVEDDAEHYRLEETAALELVDWGANPSTTRRSGVAVRKVTSSPKSVAEGYAWRRLSVTIDESTIAPTWHGMIMPTTPASDYGKNFLRPHEVLAMHSPQLGVGVGITVFSGDAVYKNFTIIPVKTPNR